MEITAPVGILQVNMRQFRSNVTDKRICCNAAAVGVPNIKQSFQIVLAYLPNKTHKLLLLTVTIDSLQIFVISFVVIIRSTRYPFQQSNTFIDKHSIWRVSSTLTMGLKNLCLSMHCVSSFLNTNKKSSYTGLSRHSGIARRRRTMWEMMCNHLLESGD